MVQASDTSDEQLIAEHLDFFAKNGSGCAFAVQAARDAARHDWAIRIVRDGQVDSLDLLLREAVADPDVSTLSVVFPDTRTDEDLDALLPRLACDTLFLHEKFDTEHNRCYRFRARVGEEDSYVSGFGPYNYMPVTRHTSATSIVLRVAARPNYSWYLKEPTLGIVHVADMDMKGVSDRNLKRMWANSFLRVAGLLGHSPNDESAAKTTFVIPLDRAQQILI